MKKVLALALVMLLAFPVFGTLQTVSAEKEKKTIAFCVADADDMWLSYLYDEANKFAEENSEEFNFVFGDAKNDLAEQLSLVENWVLQGVNAIVVNPMILNPLLPSLTCARKMAFISSASIARWQTRRRQTADAMETQAIRHS